MHMILVQDKVIQLQHFFHGIDILFGQVPETGVVLDAKKEALRIRKNKSLGQKINSTPSPAIEKNSGKSVLIK